MYLVASVRPSVRPPVRPSVRPSPLSRLSAAKSKEESLSVRGVCLCVELSRGCGRSAFNYKRFWSQGIPSPDYAKP